jgi:hypothetical protein
MSRSQGAGRALRRRLRHGGLVAALAASALMVALLAACGGGGGAGAAGGAEDVVKQWVEGWQQASGLRRDDITAGQLRLLLTGDLETQARAQRVGGSSTSGTGSRSLGRVYNDMMLLPFPPDQGFEIVSAEGDEESATVVAKLSYSDTAAGVAAANGLIEFAQVQQVHGAITAGPTRTFHLVKVEGDWKIQSITE